jgi:hypothetical protein
MCRSEALGDPESAFRSFRELLNIETKAKWMLHSSSRQPFVAARNAEVGFVKWNGPCWHFDRSEKIFLGSLVLGRASMLCHSTLRKDSIGEQCRVQDWRQFDSAATMH